MYENKSFNDHSLTLHRMIWCTLQSTKCGNH